MINCRLVKLRVFPRRLASQGQASHAVAKTTVACMTLVCLLLGIIVGEYDDAPGAVVIFPLTAYAVGTLAYAALQRMCFGLRKG